MSNEDNLSPQSQLSSHFLWDLLDSIIGDVASECHRIARLGLERSVEEEEEEIRASAQARMSLADPSNSASEANGKCIVDIFGQTHPSVASDLFDCMNCGRSVVAGKFAPHLEKCMGKGRKARLKVTRSSTVAQSRGSRASPAAFSNRTSNGTSSLAMDEYFNGSLDDHH